MIRFFRRIRHKLFSERKISQYLFYAIGEIVLVVIGILIALNINNWNERRNNKIEEIDLLKALQSDFSESKERLDLKIREQQQAINLSQRLLTIYENDEFYDVDSLPVMIYEGALAWFRFEPVTGAYDAIIGAGKLGLIENDEIREMLAQFYADIAPGFEDQDVSMNLLNGIYRELGSDLLPLRDSLSLTLTGMKPYKEKLDLNAKSIMGNGAFFGLLYGKTFIEGFRLNHYLEWIKRVESLQEAIKKEIDWLEED